MTTTRYVLVDFENVQPNHPQALAALQEYAFKVLLFVGANQAKIPFDLASAMQNLGDSARYVKITGSGRNALDFHIAYYLGQLVRCPNAHEPDACFYVISRDKGFDPLIAHLNQQDIQVRREARLEDIALARVADVISNEEKLAVIVKNLSRRGSSKPGRVETLANTINALFEKRLSESQLELLIKGLEEKRYIQMSDARIEYDLPQPDPV